MYLDELANEMKRTDKIAEIMQQRKEKEIQALNKVSTTQTKCLHVDQSHSHLWNIAKRIKELKIGENLT